MNQKKLDKFLKDLNISVIKTKKIPKHNFAVITFSNKESVEEGVRILRETTLDGKLLQVNPAPQRIKEPLTNDDDSPNNSKRKLSIVEDDSFKSEEDLKLNTLEKSKKKIRQSIQQIEDVVTPWWRIPYENQLEKKREDVSQFLKVVLRRIKKESAYNIPEWIRGKHCLCEFTAVYASPIPSGYRNKVSFSIGVDIRDQPCIGFALGRMKEGIDSVADPSNCLNVSDCAKKIRNMFQNFINTSSLKPYSKYSHSGYWRQLTVRTYRSGQIMVIMQVNPRGTIRETIENENKRMIEFCRSEQDLQLTSLMVQYSDSVSNYASNDATVELLFGMEQVYETILNLKFFISPGAFFQVNTSSTELLYNIVRDWCPKDQDTVLLDVCCGTGAIGLCMATDVKEVIGFEMEKDAIKDANKNAEINGKITIEMSFFNIPIISL